MSDPCADFELALRRVGEAFAATVRFTPAGSSAPVRLLEGDPPLVRFDAALFAALAEASTDPIRYGELLGAALFADSRLCAALARAYAATRGAGAALRLRLDLDERAPELHDLRWECLPAPPDAGGGPLAAHESLRLARFLSSADMAPVAARPLAELRALVAVAAPDDLDAYNLAPIDVAAELARARAALGDIPATVLARGESEPATLEALVAALRDGPAILYLVAHGVLKDGQPFLWLEDDEGMPRRVRGSALVERLQALARRPLLVVLASCESGGGQGSQATLVALGPRLAAAGVGAVVGFQGRVALADVAAAMPVLFRELRRDGQIDRAVSAARATLIGAESWWQLALWLRGSDGRLWTTDEPTPSASLREAPFNLPSYPTPLLGRAAEIATIVAAIGERGARLLSLLGPGGIGKTRLAVAAGWALREQFPDGVIRVRLTDLRDPALVGPAIAQTLGVQDAGGSLEAALCSWVGERRLLLILDNFEQVVAAAPLLSALMLGAPRLALLVTSRAALNIGGEQLLHLAPLALPGEEIAALRPAARVAALNTSPAVALFVERAAAARPGFSLSPANAVAVAGIVTQLDGLPLALELAAARVKLLAPEALLARLSHRLDLLRGGPQELADHQRTLRGTIAWSYDLLDAGERELFARLAVFAGGFTLEAAEAVCGGAGLPLEVLDGLSSLIDKSLVVRRELPDGELRCFLLVTIRDFAAERLDESGGAERVRRAHSAYFLAQFQTAFGALVGPQQSEALRSFDRENDNLRAALGCYLEFLEGVRPQLDGPQQGAALDQLEHERGRVQGALAAGAALADGAALAALSVIMARFWYIRGYLREGQQWIGRALALGDRLAPQDRARLLGAAASLALGQGDLDRAEALCGESLVLARELGNQSNELSALNNLGIVARRRGDFALARERYEQSLALARALDHQQARQSLLANLGNLALDQDDLAGAERYFTESLALLRAAGNQRDAAGVLINLGHARLRAQDLEGARPRFAMALRLAEELGDSGLNASARYNLAYIALAERQPAEAATQLEGALRLWRTLGARPSLAGALSLLARARALQGEPLRAARLWGASDALREAAGLREHVAEFAAGHAEAVAAVRAALGEEPFEQTLAEGAALGLEQALAEALDEL